MWEHYAAISKARDLIRDPMLSERSDNGRVTFGFDRLIVCECMYLDIIR